MWLYPWAEPAANLGESGQRCRTTFPISSAIPRRRLPLLRPGMRLFDIGCGAGDVWLLAAELAGPAGVVAGVDRSAQAVTAARDRAGWPVVRNFRTLMPEIGDQSKFSNKLSS